MPQLTLTPEQQLLRDSAQQLLRAAAPISELRRQRDQPAASGLQLELWRELAQLGWIGSSFPEAYGGAGLGHTELGVVLEACGATLAATPLLSSVLLAGGAILEAGSEAQKLELLPAIASGELLAALAFEERPRFAPHHVECTAERSGHAFRLTGHKRFVLDGHAADKLIVSARTSGASGARTGVSLFLVDPKSPGVRIRRTALIDSRSAATLSLEAVEVPAAALLGPIDQGAEVLDRVLDRAVIGLCAELLGLVTQAYEITLEYLKTRVQFDVLIGSFQALQHRAVDMFCELELAKSIVAAALSAVDRRADDVPLLASAAKAKLCEVSRLVTREAIQLHGGIGMTDEHDIGLYLKRAAVAEACLGDLAYHRDRFARLQRF